MKKLILLPILLLVIAGCMQSVRPIYWETAIQVCEPHDGVRNFTMKVGGPTMLYCNDGSQFPQHAWYSSEEK